MKSTCVPFSHSAKLVWWFCALFFSVFYAPITGSFCKALMSPRNKLAQTPSLLSLSLPPSFFFFIMIVCCLLSLKWALSKLGCDSCKGTWSQKLFFLCVCVSSFLSHMSGRGEISTGKSLETFHPPQQIGILRGPTPQQKFRTACLTPCSYAKLLPIRFSSELREK